MIIENEDRETPLPRLAVSIPKACAAIGLGRTAFYALVKAGQIRVVKLGRRTLVPMEELAKLLAPKVDGGAR